MLTGISPSVVIGLVGSKYWLPGFRWKITKRGIQCDSPNIYAPPSWRGDQCYAIHTQSSIKKGATTGSAFSLLRS